MSRSKQVNQGIPVSVRYPNRNTLEELQERIEYCLDRDFISKGRSMELAVNFTNHCLDHNRDSIRLIKEIDSGRVVKLNSAF